MCGFVTKSVAISLCLSSHMLPLLWFTIVLLLLITGFHEMKREMYDKTLTESFRNNGPVMSDELHRKDQLCSSISENVNGCELHAFRQPSEFYKKLEVNDDIYVCDDSNCTQEEVYNKIASLNAPPLKDQFGTLSGIIHNSQSRGINPRVANYILKGNTEDDSNTLRARHAILKDKQDKLGPIVTEANKKYEKYKKKLQLLGEPTWYNYCEGTPYQANYWLGREPDNLDSRQKLCYDAYWLW